MELVKLNDYAISERVNDLREILSENLCGESLNASDLEMVKVPAAGGTNWMVQSIGGEVACKDITGVVVFMMNRRSFWSKPMGEGGSEKPDCSSNDGVVGVGAPGGACSHCPMSEWGSGKNNSQACRQSRLIFVLRKDDILPICIKAPATSLKNLKSYFVRLGASKDGMNYRHCITKFSLEAATSNAGLKYSVIVPSFVGKLDPEACQKIDAVTQTIMPSIKKTAAEVAE